MNPPITKKPGDTLHHPHEAADLPAICEHPDEMTWEEIAGAHVRARQRLLQAIEDGDLTPAEAHRIIPWNPTGRVEMPAGENFMDFEGPKELYPGQHSIS